MALTGRLNVARGEESAGRREGARRTVDSVDLEVAVLAVVPAAGARAR